MRIWTRYLAVFAIATTMAVATTGCDDDDPSGSGSGTTTTTVAPTTTTTVAPTTTTTVAPTTTTTSTTSTTIALPTCDCTVTWSVTNTETLGSLQSDTDYSGASGSFVGTGGAVSCTAQAGDFTAFNDIDAEQKLSAATISTGGFTGPIDVATCTFRTTNGALAPSDFAVTITDQAAPDFSATSATLAITDVTCGAGCGGGATTTTTVTTVTSSTSSTSTTVTSTTLGGDVGGPFTVTLALDDAVTLGALQFTVVYDTAPGEFDGSADTVSCTSPLSATGAFVTWNDDDSGTNATLNFAAVALSGFTGPTTVGTCSFTATATPSAAQFVVTVVDASDPALSPITPLPTVSVTVAPTVVP